MRVRVRCCYVGKSYHISEQACWRAPGLYQQMLGTVIDNWVACLICKVTFCFKIRHAMTKTRLLQPHMKTSFYLQAVKTGYFTSGIV